MDNLGESIAAIVVTYNPDEVVLNQLLTSLSMQVDRVFVVDNGSSNLKKNDSGNISWIPLVSNTGIANAQNVGIKNVVDLGFENLILFDQDSAISEGFVGNLLDARNKAELSGLSIAAVGPVHIDVDTKEKSVISLTKDRRLVKLRPVSDSDDFTQSDFIIASGCLISVSALNVVGLMDSELFIDCVDIEWCYRAKSKDLVCIVALGEMMYHKVGDAPLSILGRNFTTHNPLRHYYYYRNFYILLRRPYISLAWKRYTFLKSSAQAIIFCCFLKPRIQHFKYIIKGIFHGIIGRKGKYE